MKSCSLNYSFPQVGMPVKTETWLRFVGDLVLNHRSYGSTGYLRWAIILLCLIFSLTGLAGIAECLSLSKGWARNPMERDKFLGGAGLHQ